jgi:lipid-A-disaccharide synthase
MHLFISAGEPSGDLHGANLIRAMAERHPGLSISGLGGDRMREEGADLVFPLADMAAMWLGRVIRNLPTYFKVLRQVDVHIRTTRPDAVVLIDCPGFNWHVAKVAHRAGVPVFYFVPPQLWAWAGWRVSKMRRWVQTVMTALPFEDGWYRERGVKTHYIGHPYFDEIAEQKLDQQFITSRKQDPGPVVALLPGSRNQEVTANFPLMLGAAARIQAAVPGVRFLIASFKESQARTARDLMAGSGLPAEIHVGRTPEIIEAADACIAVSGSVGLELMSRLKPTVVVYRIAPFARWVSKQFITCRYISLVNLLADAELFPEYLTTRDNPDAVASHVIEWLTRPASRNAVVTRLKELREQAAVPGACERAAEFLLDEIGSRAARSVIRAA